MNASSFQTESEISSLYLDQEDDTKKYELVVCMLKLFAVRDQDQKLIGVVNFSIDWKSQKSILKDHKVLSFQKCIDPNANITVSARLIDNEPENICES